ncbi:MAG: hypothetical protein ABL998_18485, partial [Planctomycetota bacterium]
SSARRGVPEMIGKVGNVKNQAILATAYADALHAAKVAHSVADIDGERMAISSWSRARKTAGSSLTILPAAFLGGARCRHSRSTWYCR